MLQTFTNAYARQVMALKEEMQWDIWHKHLDFLLSRVATQLNATAATAATDDTAQHSSISAFDALLLPLTPATTLDIIRSFARQAERNATAVARNANSESPLLPLRADVGPELSVGLMSADLSAHTVCERLAGIVQIMKTHSNIKVGAGCVEGVCEGVCESMEGEWRVCSMCAERGVRGGGVSLPGFRLASFRMRYIPSTYRQTIPLTLP